ncbi:MAG: hypothetical protein NT124_00090 [Candidatus Dependentiae bacterium]|nr:hypothetical protein [Candidatus Dependentiae bacterium]
MEQKIATIIDIDHIFSGNIFIFHAFDIGDDIHLDNVSKLRAVNTIPLPFPKHFKNYHIPLTIELPHPHASNKNIGCKIHNFGAISITYKIPFADTLSNLREQFNEIHNQYQEQSIIDARSIYKKIESEVSKARFFQTHTSYMVMQINPIPDKIDVQELKKMFGGIIVSTLRFEQVALSEEQKNEILDDGIGYFRGDLIVIDTETAFIYDKQYEEILDFFEFANVQLVELQYFDRLLDQRLNTIYEGEGRNPSWRSYLPFLNMTSSDPIELLGKLKVDISVITERLESSIKVVGEPYFSELYELLVEKLDLGNWRSGIDRKLSIIHDIQSTYQHRIDIIREDILSVLVIVLILIEVIIGILK